jgi:ubiquinone/menaquinone biosynthesis C-methylase UbiE
MNVKELLEHLSARVPVSELPLEWDATGYTTESFNEWAGSEDFDGWNGDRSPEEEARVMVDLLGLKPGARVLDVACGYGRHASVLASEHGLNVTGIDISPGLIAAAERLARERGLAIAYRLMHGRDLDWEDTFEGAIVAFNSFSLFAPDDALRILRGIRRGLRKQSRLFMDLDNKPYESRYGTSETNWLAHSGALNLQEVWFHKDISVEVCRDLSVGIHSEEVDEFVTLKRLYDRDEITELLEASGFRVERLCGGWDLLPLDDSSTKILIVGTKE